MKSAAATRALRPSFYRDGDGGFFTNYSVVAEQPRPGAVEVGELPSPKPKADEGTKP